MTSGGQNGPNSPDGLMVRAILVPDGESVPDEWLAQHPDAIRVRATLVPRHPPSTQTETTPQPSLPGVDAPRSERDRHRGLEERGHVFSGVGSPEPGSLGPGYDDPMAAYLRLRDALAGVGKEQAGASPEHARHTAPNALQQGEENGDPEVQDSPDQEQD